MRFPLLIALSISLSLLIVQSVSAGRLPEAGLTFEPSSAPGEFFSRGHHYGIFLSAGGIAYIGSGGRKYRAMKFLGVRPGAQLTADDRRPGTSSYFLGSSESWRIAVPHFRRAVARDIYTGIDLAYHGENGALEYDFVVKPGANLNLIRFSFPDSTSVRVSPDGGLLITSPSGMISESRPLAYQTERGRRIPVDAKFRINRSGSVQFVVRSFNRSLPITIDPVIDFGTLLGGSGIDGATGVAIDSAGNIYVVGSTESSDFPNTGKLPSAPAANAPDVFVTKLDATGATILYSVVLGGSQADTASAIVVDASGNAYVVGQTQSANFPGAGCVGDPTEIGGVPFIFKLNTTGTALSYASCFSTNPTASPNGIALDGSGNVYVAGSVNGTFPTTAGSAQPNPAPLPPDYGPPSTGFVVKMDANAQIVYSSYIGGSADTSALAVAVDGSGNAYVTGTTESKDFPVTPGVFQGVLTATVGGNAFVAKLNAAGSAFVYSTYLGGQGSDSGNAIAVDPAGHAYVTGQANGGAGPGPPLPFPTTPGVFIPASDLDSGFLTELSPNASSLVFSTYLPQGDSRYSASGLSLALDALGDVYVMQEFTSDTDFIGVNLNPSVTISGFSVLKINPGGTALLDSQFIGNVQASAAAFDTQGGVVIAGSTTGTAPVTPGIAQQNVDGFQDAFVSRLDFASANAPALQIDVQHIFFDQPDPTRPPLGFEPVTFNLTSSGAPIPFRIIPAQNTSVSIQEGTTPSAVTISQMGTAAVGSFSYLSIVATGARNGYIVVPVAANQQTPVASLSPPTFTFSANSADNLTPSQSGMLRVLYSPAFYLPPTDLSVPFTVTQDPTSPWLSVTPTSGTTPAQITLTVNPAGLTQGLYTAAPVIKTPYGSLGLPLSGFPGISTFSVSLSVGPFLQVSALQPFDFPLNQTPVAQTVQVTSSGAPLAFNILSFGVPSWVSVTPTSGVTPASLTLTVNPSGLSNGNYTASVPVSGKGYGIVLPVKAQVGPPPAPTPSIAFAAMAAPGSLLSLYGTNLVGSAIQAAPPYPTQLGGAMVKIGGFAAPLLYINPYQANIQVPFEVAPGETQLVFSNALGTASADLQIVPADPAFFFATTPGNATIAVILNQDGALNTPTAPAQPGDYITLYMNGQGVLDRPLADGQAAPSAPLIHPALPVTATIGGLNAFVQFAGLAPGFVGLFQVNLQVPDIIAGDQGVIVNVGSYSNELPVPITVAAP
jgi:uncharacterized protein (TIGR03437 family)